MPYTIGRITGIIKGTLQHSKHNCQIRYLLHDSRAITFPETSLFFAIRAPHNDGHRYVTDAYRKGVRNFVVSGMEKEFAGMKGASFIFVKDTLTALQTLCAFHRTQFNIPVIGITGSNGKTIIKEWLFHLLSDDYRIVRSPKSYNSQIGVPLSVWQMANEDTLAIFEAGISKPGEMKRLQKIILPRIGIFSNIGNAHSENFINTIEKLKEKLELFVNVKTLVYSSDHLIIDREIRKAGLHKKMKCMCWSKKHRADLQIISLKRDNNSTHIDGRYQNKHISISIPFIDDASAENAIHCWLVLLFLGYDNDIIRERMKTLSPVAMRLEMKEGINRCSIINDFYNSDTGSLAVALDFMNRQKQHKTRTVILSDILQSGKKSDALYGEVAHLLEAGNVNQLIGIGNNIRGQVNKFHGMRTSFFTTTEEFLQQYPLSGLQNSAILLKGARVFEFERINRALEKKSHETVLEINLNALIQNLNFFRTKIKPSVKVMAMVKAFSYGSGSYEIANILQHHNADYLAVACADEGVELRNAGITLPIVVMNPETGTFDLMLQHSLEPEIYNFRILKLLDAFLTARAITSSTPFSIHIKIDTGMHRLGFLKNEINELVKFLKTRPYLNIKSVFSHLAASDESAHDKFTREQINLFNETSGSFCRNFSYPVLRHILNSAGIVRFPDAHFDMVRLGIGLYGIGNDEIMQKKLQQVSRLKSVIAQVKTIPPGESVGYGRMAISDKERKIAIVPVGYADGLDRKLGNGIGKLLINGKFAPVTGNICMDLCMVDITGITASEGDEVIIFGEEFSVAEFARQADTIPYEVMTGISGRVKRVYFYE
ncbi:MAG: bifunctional UDP-N-acetylmuramoyl-tripeptide:D-alanyl-D-alanine ligase/alanine racemase [Bacteroidetes bacterium]|nr:bifunctional UDP-N-acetylmuramoyl-tripeptide:D-alanyl-D-alanine ligase/alanine racemase [Bacteroidota bacterium]